MCQSSSCFCYNFPFVLNLLFLGQKSSLVSGEWAGEIFLSLTCLQSQICIRKYIYINIYIYIFLKHKHRQTNAKETKEEKRKTKETKEAAILGL